MEKILIIDDEKNILVSLASILEDEGYKVYFAQSGEVGIEKFKNIRPEAIFLDIWLPGMDGIEVMRKILEIDPTQIIIMISGHVNISTAVSAVREGAYDFLEKPLSLDKVIFVLKRAMEYKKLMKENLKLKSLIEHKNGNRTKQDIKKEPTLDMKFKIDDTKIYRKQKTVKSSNIYYGLGLHSGVKTGLSIQPLPSNKGIRFENISKFGYVPARIDFLSKTNYATSLKRNDIEAYTIEHFMACLHAFGITNLLIKIDKEVPIGDGSASDFCRFIRESDIVEQESIIPVIEITKTLIIGEESEDGKFIKIEPNDKFIVKYTTIYPEPLGKNTYEFVMEKPEDFEKEIAPARTYGFVEELNKLSSMGLAEGGRINNFIMIQKNGKILNTELRFENELARHKILDIIGDMYLLGAPIKGKITAQKTGHSENAQLVKLIKVTFL